METAQALLKETEKLLEKWKHPDPYCAPTAPGGALCDERPPVHRVCRPNNIAQVPSTRGIFQFTFWIVSCNTLLAVSRLYWLTRVSTRSSPATQVLMGICEVGMGST